LWPSGILDAFPKDIRTRRRVLALKDEPQHHASGAQCRDDSIHAGGQPGSVFWGCLAVLQCLEDDQPSSAGTKEYGGRDTEQQVALRHLHADLPVGTRSRIILGRQSRNVRLRRSGCVADVAGGMLEPTERG